MFTAEEIVNLHREAVVRWHEQEIDNPYAGILGIVCEQFSYNFLLWHEEDIARSEDVGDQRVAEVKRNIDRYNQLRNDWIEKIDDAITEQLSESGVETSGGAPHNSETVGSVVDRLSILALRIYHMEEQMDRSDVDSEHIEKVQHKLAVCFIQLDDLSNALQHLVDDILAGRKLHKTYRQFKMYNDPTLNPYLYKTQQRKAG